MLQRNARSGFGVLGCVDIEEWVDWIDRPCGHRDAMTRRPQIDLAQAFVNQRFAQAIA